MHATNERAIRGITWSLVLITVLWVTGCDLLDPDSINHQAPLEIKDDPIYVMPDQPGIIDLNALIISSGNHQMAVTGQPKFGTLTSIGNNILQYQPNEGVSEARDGFTFSVFGANNVVIREDSVIIIVTEDPQAYPCGLYAFDDHVYNVDGPVVIDVLANDSACNVNRSLLTVEHFGLKIHPNASYGTVNILPDGRIEYVPGSNYEGFDIVYYLVTKPANIPAQGDPEEVSSARIYINGPEDCDSLEAFDDIYSVKIDTVMMDSIPPQRVDLYDTLHMSFTGNDSWCPELFPQITIIEEPEGFLINYGFNPLVYAYVRPAGAVHGDRDRFRYRLCAGGRCSEAEVLIFYR